MDLSNKLEGGNVKTQSLIQRSLSVAINESIVDSLLTTYDKMIKERRLGGVDECLTQAGKFVEHTLRAVEYIRVGSAPAEVKQPSEFVRTLEKDKSLPDSLRLLIPKIAYAMIYEIRSKRGAVHVKEIDARQIDASLCVQAASWIISEFIRLYHVDDEIAVADAMSALMRSELPLTEVIGGETIVTGKISCPVELLLLLGQSREGLDRTILGAASKSGSSTVSKTLSRLNADRLIHKTADGRFHITGPGEQYLGKAVSAHRR